MTRHIVVTAALADATRRGLQTCSIEGVEWRRQPSGWAKTFSWLNDPKASYTFAELGVDPRS